MLTDSDEYLTGTRNWQFANWELTSGSLLHELSEGWIRHEVNKSLAWCVVKTSVAHPCKTTSKELFTYDICKFFGIVSPPSPCHCRTHATYQLFLLFGQLYLQMSYVNVPLAKWICFCPPILRVPLRYRGGFANGGCLALWQAGGGRRHVTSCRIPQLSNSVIIQSF